MNLLARTGLLVPVLLLLMSSGALAQDPTAAGVEEGGFLTTLGELIWDGGVLMIPIALASVVMSVQLSRGEPSSRFQRS